MNHRKTIQIGCLGLLITSWAQADVRKLCQKLNEQVSLDQELAVCAALPPSLEKTESVIKSGESTTSSYVYEDRAEEAFFSHPVEDFTNQTLLGAEVIDIRAMAFDQNGTVLYAIENLNKNLLTVDQTTGTTAVVGPLTNANSNDVMTGIEIMADGTCYVTGTDETTSTLYTCDLSTGTLTVVGSQSTNPFIIGIAADCDGNLYGHDIDNDNIQLIDTGTGATSLLGATGIDANFSQDITYDRNLQHLYGYIYQGENNNTYGRIDVCTGSATALSVNNPIGEFSGGASKTSCAQSDVISRRNQDC